MDDEIEDDDRETDVNLDWGLQGEGWANSCDGYRRFREDLKTDDLLRDSHRLKK